MTNLARQLSEASYSLSVLDSVFRATGSVGPGGGSSAAIRERTGNELKALRVVAARAQQEELQGSM